MSEADQRRGSIFENIPPDLSEEFFETLRSSDGLRIERIVSRGHASPEGFWYDLAQNEFVVLIQGSAGLKIEGEDGIISLKPGDYVNIPSHLKHRVEWTDPECQTIWLAVHYWGRP